MSTVRQGEGRCVCYVYIYVVHNKRLIQRYLYLLDSTALILLDTQLKLLYNGDMTEELGTGYNHLREYLLPKLAEREMSIEEFARAIDVTRACVYFYLDDRTRPREQVAIRMSQVLGVPAEEVMRQYTPRKVGKPRGLK